MAFHHKKTHKPRTIRIALSIGQRSQAATNITSMGWSEWKHLLKAKRWATVKTGTYRLSRLKSTMIRRRQSLEKWRWWRTERCLRATLIRVEALTNLVSSRTELETTQVIGLGKLCNLTPTWPKAIRSTCVTNLQSIAWWSPTRSSVWARCRRTVKTPNSDCKIRHNRQTLYSSNLTILDFRLQSDLGRDRT